LEKENGEKGNVTFIFLLAPAAGTGFPARTIGLRRTATPELCVSRRGETYFGWHSPVGRGEPSLYLQVCVRMAKYPVARSGLTALGAGLLTPPQIANFFVEPTQLLLTVARVTMVKSNDE
jgi:hypothetical protein